MVGSVVFQSSLGVELSQSAPRDLRQPPKRFQARGTVVVAGVAHDDQVAAVVDVAAVGSATAMSLWNSGQAFRGFPSTQPLALAACGDAVKDLEIVVLRHQLAVLRRQIPHDAKFSRSFDDVFRSQGGEVPVTPVRAPKVNPYAERWIHTNWAGLEW